MTDVAITPDWLRGALVSTFGSRVEEGAPLARHTTFGIGGPADWLVEVRSADEMLALVVIARDAHVPLTIIGSGSNLLVADRGVRGIVARVHGGDVRREGESLVRADAGVTVNGLVRWTIGLGLAGLEAWAGTPGTVGGALHGNAHFQGRLIGDTVGEVRVVSRDGVVSDLPASEMRFGYDTSRLQTTGEVVLSATFAVSQGDPQLLREIARASLAFRKRTQPLHLPSAGCIFQNPDPRRDVVPTGVPRSAGALIDLAGLKGASAGGARVSPSHANFIVNEGGATAADVRTLVERCRSAVAERFGIVLRDEIVYAGEFQ